MIKRLTKVGNSHALIIDKTILGILQIEADTEFRIHVTKNHNLLLEPLRKYKKAKEPLNDKC